MSRTTRNYWFLSDSSSYLVFDDVSGWYGSKTGADDLWVLPNAASPAGGNGICHPMMGQYSALLFSWWPLVCPSGRPSHPPCLDPTDRSQSPRNTLSHPRLLGQLVSFIPVDVTAVAEFPLEPIPNATESDFDRARLIPITSVISWLVSPSPSVI